MARTIVFGDIHGCVEEWKALLAAVNPSSEDRLIAVGDLVAKGPDSAAVLSLAQSLPNLQCVLGNHEAALLRLWRGTTTSERSPSAAATLEQLGDAAPQAIRFIETWPLYLELEACTVVHAGIRPGKPLGEQTPEDLLTLRTLEDGTPWFEAYEGKPLIVHGHWAMKGLTVMPNSIGLDTGCVYGRQLSAVILPERLIVSVPAKRVYQAYTA